MDALIESIKVKNVMSQRELALNALRSFSKLINENKFQKFNFRSASSKDILMSLKKYTTLISKYAKPHALSVENIALRLLKIAYSISGDIDDDILSVGLRDSFNISVSSIRSVYQPETDVTSENKTVHLRETLQQEIMTCENEILTSTQDICVKAIDHIHENDTIMVFGYSRTVRSFIRKAATKRNIRLIVCQNSPTNKGHVMVKKLANEPNIDITLIPDSNIFALMSRVNKVILSCYSVSADGSACCDAGTDALTLAAVTFGVPVIICTGLYKLTPRFQISTVNSHNIDCNLLVSPGSVLNFNTASSLGPIQIMNPKFDHISSKNISLFITNVGAQSSSYMYRTIKELYNLDEPLH